MSDSLVAPFPKAGTKRKNASTAAGNASKKLREAKDAKIDSLLDVSEDDELLSTGNVKTHVPLPSASTVAVDESSHFNPDAAVKPFRCCLYVKSVHDIDWTHHKLTTESHIGELKQTAATLLQIEERIGNVVMYEADHDGKPIHAALTADRELQEALPNLYSLGNVFLVLHAIDEASAALQAFKVAATAAYATMRPSHEALIAAQPLRPSVVSAFVGRYREAFELMVMMTFRNRFGKPFAPMLQQYPGSGKTMLALRFAEVLSRPPESLKERKEIAKVIASSPFAKRPFLDEILLSGALAAATTASNSCFLVDFFTYVAEHGSSMWKAAAARCLLLRDAKPFYINFSDSPTVSTHLATFVQSQICKQLGVAELPTTVSPSDFFETLAAATNRTAIVVLDEFYVMKARIQELRECCTALLNNGVFVILTGASVQHLLQKLHYSTLLECYPVLIQPFEAKHVQQMLQLALDVEKDISLVLSPDVLRHIGDAIQKSTGGHARSTAQALNHILSRLSSGETVSATNVDVVLHQLSKSLWIQSYIRDYFNNYRVDKAVYGRVALAMVAASPLPANTLVPMPKPLTSTKPGPLVPLHEALVGFPIAYSVEDGQVKLSPGTWQRDKLAMYLFSKLSTDELSELVLEGSSGAPAGDLLERLMLATLRWRIQQLKMAATVSRREVPTCQLRDILPFLADALGMNEEVDLEAFILNACLSLKNARRLEAPCVVKGIPSVDDADMGLFVPKLDILFQLKRVVNSYDASLNLRSLFLDARKAFATTSHRQVFVMVPVVLGYSLKALFEKASAGCSQDMVDILILKEGDYKLHVGPAALDGRKRTDVNANTENLDVTRRELRYQSDISDARRCFWMACLQPAASHPRERGRRGGEAAVTTLSIPANCTIVVLNPSTQSNIYKQLFFFHAEALSETNKHTAAN